MEQGETIKTRIIKNMKYFLSLMTKSDLRVKALISYFCWFSISMVYYGVSLNSENMSTDPYVYMLLGGTVEVISLLMLWIIVKYVGRRLTLISLYILCSVTISSIAVLMVTLDEVPTSIKLGLSLTGKLGITAAYQLIFVYTAELFPTQYRSLAIGESDVIGRAGSILSPYVNDILGATISWGPSALFSLVSLIAAGLSFFLPETKGTDLIEEEDKREDGNPENGAKLCPGNILPTGNYENV